MTYGQSAAKSSVEKLENDLLDAREAVLDLLPHDLHELVRAYHRCESRDEELQWRERVIEHVRATARVIPRHEIWNAGERAYCPLCGRGSSSPYDKGFSFPDGLLQHLEGRGNTRQCTVTKVIFRMAREDLHPKLRAEST